MKKNELVPVGMVNRLPAADGSALHLRRCLKTLMHRSLLRRFRCVFN